MSTWSNSFSKNAISPTNVAANSATMERYMKGGAGWEYNRAGLKYNETTDTLSNLRVYYNSLGVATSFSNLSKN